MRRATTHAVLVWLCVSPHTAKAFQTATRATVVEEPFAKYATIFVAELVSVRPVESCDVRLDPLCARRVRTWVSRILKDETQQGLVPVAFDAVIPSRPAHIFSVPPGWAPVFNIDAGQRYLILSGRQAGIKPLFESPEAVLLLSDDDDAVVDVELILSAAHLTFPEKVSAVAAAVANARKPQHFFLATYAMSLLDAGPPSETSSLVQTIEEASVSAFSSHGWRSLLYHLWDLSRNTTSPRGSAPHLLVELTVKYLVFAPDHHMQGEPDTQQEIRDRLLPWIRNSEGSLSDFQTALRTLLTDTRTHVTSEQRARLVEWLRDADSWSVAKVH